MSDRPLLTINQLCERLNVVRSTVYNMINRGEIPVIRVGSVYRFSPDWVDEYLKAESDRSYQRWERRENGCAE